MAIKFYENYPGRSLPASTRYPQGGFKNRSAPDSKDGTYLEQDWANDISGFLQFLMSKAGITANGQPDDALGSQYAEALIKYIQDKSVSVTGNDGLTGGGKLDEDRLISLSDSSKASLAKADAALPSSNAFGVGQSWGEYTSVRAYRTIYTNSTGRPIMVSARVSGAKVAVWWQVDGVRVGYGHDSGPDTTAGAVAVVPNGGTYQLNGSDVGTILEWNELR